MTTFRARLLVIAIGALSSLVAGRGAAADISITNTTLPNPAIVRRNLTYGMNVINNGPEPATNVVVTDILPPSVIVVSAVFRFQDRPPMPCTGTLTITSNIGTLAGGRLDGAALFTNVQPQAIHPPSHT